MNIDWDNEYDILDFYVSEIEEDKYDDLYVIEKEIIKHTKNKKLARHIIEVLSDILSWRAVIDARSNVG